MRSIFSSPRRSGKEKCAKSGKNHATHWLAMPSAHIPHFCCTVCTLQEDKLVCMSSACLHFFLFFFFFLFWLYTSTHCWYLMPFGSLKHSRKVFIWCNVYLFVCVVLLVLTATLTACVIHALNCFTLIIHACKMITKLIELEWEPERETLKKRGCCSSLENSKWHLREKKKKKT